ncbi:MAG: PQQ-binding-like beta-propeller repeat protein, partial [Planctomycetes bacterium]|nr:PQQ-binding-like beta-propeller repeat protein [Planctomycetota bacterium]
MTRKLILAIGCFVLAGASLSQAQDWPQWRGPGRDNKLVGFSEPKTWPKELTKKWQVTVGIGEASPVLVGDKIYTFSRLGGDEAATCLDAANGKEVWQVKYAAAFGPRGDGAYPGPRSTPAVGEGKICTLGVNGLFICRDAATGKELWRQDKGFPQFHTSTSPIIVDGKVIVLTGSLSVFDLADGKPKWS